MTKKIGLDCNLYYNSGTYGSPSWAAVDAVRESSLEIVKGEADATSRGGNGWREILGTLKDATLNVTFVKDSSDTNYVALETAFRNGTKIEIAVADGEDGSGTNWFTAKWDIMSWNESQPLEDAITVEATFRPTPDADLSPTFGTDALPTTRP